MAEQQRQGYCEQCRDYTLVKRKGVTHILHLLLSVITFGAWILVWIFLTIFNVGGWRCQTCGSDQIKDTGEMLSVRGWIVISLLALVFVPMLMALFPDTGFLSEELAGYLGLVPVVALPVLAVMAYQHHQRKRDRIAGNETPASPPPKPKTESAKPEPKPTPKEKPKSETPSYRPPRIDKAAADTSAAEEFRRRMRDAESD